MSCLVLCCLLFSVVQATTIQECNDEANKKFSECLKGLNTENCTNELKEDFDKCGYSPNEIGSIINPLGVGSKDVPTLVSNIIRAILTLVGSIALVLFIVAGVQWMAARGNPEQVKKATQTMLWSAIGLLVIFSSYMILDFVFKILTAK